MAKIVKIMFSLAAFALFNDNEEDSDGYNFRDERLFLRNRFNVLDMQNKK